MHGISTHSVKYVQLPPTTESDGNDSTTTPRNVSTTLMIDTFLKNQVSVYAFDLYGHGYSEGIRFFIPESYKINVQDYIKFSRLVAADNIAANVPIFFMGESYGCTITLHAAKYFQDQAEPENSLPNFDSLILTAPAIIGDLPIYPVVQLLKLLGRYYPTWRPFFMPNPVSPDRIWKDPLVRECHTDKSKPENKIDGSGIPFRLGTGVQLLQALEDVRKDIIPALKTPYIVIHGTQDYGVPISGSEYLYQNSITPSDEKEFVKTEGAYHDLLADPTAEETMGHIIHWIEKRIAMHSSGKQQ
jgi:alpha-beta hydrolase superfamily lysophospholipase